MTFKLTVGELLLRSFQEPGLQLLRTLTVCGRCFLGPLQSRGMVRILTPLLTLSVECLDIQALTITACSTGPLSSSSELVCQKNGDLGPSHLIPHQQLSLQTDTKTPAWGCLYNTGSRHWPFKHVQKVLFNISTERKLLQCFLSISHQHIKKIHKRTSSNQSYWSGGPTACSSTGWDTFDQTPNGKKN